MTQPNFTAYVTARLVWSRRVVYLAERWGGGGSGSGRVERMPDVDVAAAATGRRNKRTREAVAVVAGLFGPHHTAGGRLCALDDDATSLTARFVPGM